MGMGMRTQMWKRKDREERLVWNMLVEVWRLLVRWVWRMGSVRYVNLCTRNICLVADLSSVTRDISVDLVGKCRRLSLDMIWRFIMLTTSS